MLYGTAAVRKRRYRLGRVLVRDVGSESGWSCATKLTDGAKSLLSIGRSKNDFIHTRIDPGCQAT